MKRWRALGVVLSSALFTACGGNARSDERALPPQSPGTSVPSEPPPPSDDNPPEPVPTPDVPMPGKGELGFGCATDADCVSPALDTYLTSQARPLPAPPAFASSQCVGVSVFPTLAGPSVEGPACYCLDEFGNPKVIGTAGLDSKYAGHTGE